jgi:hypothetical protein
VIDRVARQLVREAFDLFNDPNSKVDLRDWNREAKKLLCDHKFIDSVVCLKCGFKIDESNTHVYTRTDVVLAKLQQLDETVATLLAALKETLAYWDSTGFSECDEGCDCIVESVRAAIAKAESLS